MDNTRISQNRKYRVALAIILVLQVIAALYFCCCKQGFHYDENYSYYSSNVTYGLSPSDGEWMSGKSISDEFEVTKGFAFEYGMVKLMQTYDVHPPLYYFLLHTVCSLSQGMFSKWQGLGINLIFFICCEILLVLIANKISNINKIVSICSMLLFGFSPAIISGVTFIRMYMLLTFFCFTLLYICVNGLKETNRTVVKFYFPILLVTYLGFLTHYYFIVFLFFVAAYITIFLFYNKTTRKQAFYFAVTVIAGLLLGVVTYPACLSHIFRGYRGTEAIGAFKDVSNLSDRIGLFVGLLEEYLLCNSFYIVLLLILVLYISYGFIKRKQVNNSNTALINHELGLILFTVFGYFLVVMKTALMNYEEAVRYEMPVYGLIILLLCYYLVYFVNELIVNESASRRILIALFSVMLIMQVVGLFSDKVLFLYPEEKAEREFAIKNKQENIVYIYNYVNQWMIWDNAHELEQYDRIFFIEMNNEDEISDRDILDSKHLFAYVMRYEDANDKLEELIDVIPGINKAEFVEERAYADIYELK